MPTSLFANRSRLLPVGSGGGAGGRKEGVGPGGPSPSPHVLDASPGVAHLGEPRLPEHARNRRHVPRSRLPDDLLKPACLPPCFRDWWAVYRILGTADYLWVPLTCGRWSCAECAGRKRNRIMAEIFAGDPEKMMVLTTLPHPDWSPAFRLASAKDAWSKLLRWVRRRDPAFQYYRVTEWTKLNAPHFHVAFRGKFIVQAELSDYWFSLTGAFMVWIEKVKGAARAVRELSKYLSKSVRYNALHHLGSRPTSHSKHWLPSDWKDPKPEDLPRELVANVKAPHWKLRELRDRFDLDVGPSADVRFGLFFRPRGPPDTADLEQLLAFGSRGERKFAALQKLSPLDTNGDDVPIDDLKDELDYLADPYGLF